MKHFLLLFSLFALVGCDLFDEPSITLYGQGGYDNRFLPIEITYDYKTGYAEELKLELYRVFPESGGGYELIQTYPLRPGTGQSLVLDGDSRLPASNPKEGYVLAARLEHSTRSPRELWELVKYPHLRFRVHTSTTEQVTVVDTFPISYFNSQGWEGHVNGAVRVSADSDGRFFNSYTLHYRENEADTDEYLAEDGLVLLETAGDWNQIHLTFKSPTGNVSDLSETYTLSSLKETKVGTPGDPGVSPPTPGQTYSLSIDLDTVSNVYLNNTIIYYTYPDNDTRVFPDFSYDNNMIHLQFLVPPAGSGGTLRLYLSNPGDDGTDTLPIPLRFRILTINLN